MVEKPEEYFVTRYELECKLREIDKKVTTIGKDAGVEAEVKNGHLSARADKDNVAYEKRLDEIYFRINAISERLDRFLIAIIGLAITTLVSFVLMLASILFK
jgi:hypothetical protein